MVLKSLYGERFVNGLKKSVWRKVCKWTITSVWRKVCKWTITSVWGKVCKWT